MKIKNFVLAVAFILFNVGFNYAKDPINSGSKVTSAKNISEATETTNIQNTGHQGEQCALVQNVEITLPTQNDSFNLSFFLDIHPDTTNFCFIEYYIKNVAPLTKKVGFDTKSLEMLEVL